MLARVRNPFRQTAKLSFLIAAACVLASCATKEQPQLVGDPSSTRESSLPWNKQEKWEGTGQLGGMAERMGQGGR